MAGTDWFRGFLKRNPDLNETYSQHCDLFKDQLVCKISEFEPLSCAVNAAQELIKTVDIQEQWDSMVPGVQHKANSRGN